MIDMENYNPLRVVVVVVNVTAANNSDAICVEV
jgi:hypothetical protein